MEVKKQRKQPLNLEGNTHLLLKKLELRALQKEHDLRLDWHEPDEANVDAVVVGKKLDNAFGEDVYEDSKYRNIFTDVKDYKFLGDQEFVVILTKNKKEVYRINLATLLAVACM
jgi:hypothetical protein